MVSSDNSFTKQLVNFLKTLSDYNYIIKDSISLKKLNKVLPGENQLKSIPNITWISAHSFRFKHDNN